MNEKKRSDAFTLRDVDRCGLAEGVVLLVELSDYTFSLSHEHTRI